MTVETLEMELKKQILQPIYVLYGEETFLLENCVNKIKKIFGNKIDGINYIMLDETSANNIISEMDTPAFGFEKKLIIIKKPELLKRGSKLKNLQEKLNQYIEQNIEHIKQNIVLVFIEEKLDKLKITSTFEKYGAVCNFEKLKPTEIVKRLKVICIQYGVEVNEKDLSYLIDIAGTSMTNLINEIRKLIEYAGKGGKITRESIDKLVIPQIESVIFNLTDELGSKKIDKSIEIYHNLIYQKEPVQMILITLYRHFKKLYLVKLANSEGRDVKEILDLKPNQVFLISKYKRQAEYFTEDGLKKILEELIMLDQKSKQGLIDLEIGLELILCTI